MRQPSPGQLLLEVSESKITKLFIYLYVEDNATIFYNRGLCCLVCFLRKLWVLEKIPLKLVKPWEIKNLPWEAEKGSETVCHMVKLWEVRALHLFKMKRTLFRKVVQCTRLTCCYYSFIIINITTFYSSSNSFSPCKYYKNIV